MKTTIIFFLLFFAISIVDSQAGEGVYTKSDIKKLSKNFFESSNLEDPVFADVDKDGDFDILHFTKEGFVEHYDNTGSNAEPKFVLADKKYDDYEIHSILGNGFPFPAFMADADGDGDEDMFVVTEKKGQAASSIELVSNEFTVTTELLVTIILILGIIALLIYIL